MQFKTLLVAFGLAAAATGAALPESQLETRTEPTFKIRRFTPLVNFDPAIEGTWSNNQYTNIVSPGFFNYDGINDQAAFLWTFTDGTLRGSSNGNGGLVPRNLQSYETTVTPVTFGGGVGEPVKVTIGPSPLFEVTFQTVRSDSPVKQWWSFSQIGGKIFLGKASDISSPVRFRAIYTV